MLDLPDNASELIIGFDSLINMKRSEIVPIFRALTNKIDVDQEVVIDSVVRLATRDYSDFGIGMMKILSDISIRLDVEFKEIVESITLKDSFSGML
jgi:hypothetical protein